MAKIYNLAKGGYAYEFGDTCNTCGEVDSNGLPVFLQPDERVDGGYGYRDKLEWKQLLNTLERRYGKHAEDLQVGDKIYLFLQPNHATVKSIFIDFRSPVAGFSFIIKSAVTDAEFVGDVYKTNYNDCKHVESVEKNDNSGTTNKERVNTTDDSSKDDSKLNDDAKVNGGK